jgi:WD40 repeat protein/serine/threonine protein kinase
MIAIPEATVDAESLVERIVGAWQERIDAGEAVDPEAVIAAHPEVAETLRDCFKALLAVRRGAVMGPALSLREPPPERYAILRRIGEGGMGAVYRALDNDLHREVALKVARTHGATDEGREPGSLSDIVPASPLDPDGEALHQRFLQEAWVTGAMAHPGIVPVYELGQTPAGVPYYTMRLIPGDRTLGDAIEACANAGLAERLGLLEPFLRVCDTVQYAHAQYVVHRDLKPENVALGRFGEVVVVDWGLARVRGQCEPGADPWREHVAAWREAADLATSPMALGTPGYMSPEAAAGLVDEIDEFSDVFGLGAILFRILTGRTLHGACGAAEWIRRVQEVAAPDPRTLVPSVPRTLAELCQAALARDKASRPASVGAMARGIREWQAQSRMDREIQAWQEEADTRWAEVGTLEGPARIAALERVLVVCERILDARPGQGEARALRARAEARRREVLEAVVGATRRRLLRRAAAVVFVLGTIAAVLVAAVLEQKRSEAETNLARARVRGLVAASAEAETDQPMLSLLLARHAARVQEPPPPVAISRLYNALVQSHERVRFEGHTDIVHTAVFSPDGRTVLTASRDGSARLWDLDGRLRRTLDHDTPVGRAVFDATGRFVLTRSEDARRAWIWRANGEGVVALRGPDGSSAGGGFHLAPAGIFATWGDGMLRRWGLDGRALPPIACDAAEVLDAAALPTGVHVLVADAQGGIQLFGPDGRRRWRLEGGGTPWSARFSARGGAVLLSRSDWVSRLVTLEGDEVGTYRGAFGQMRDDGQRILTSTADHQLLVHDREGTLLATLHPAGRVASSVAFMPGERRIALACYDSTLRLWDPAGLRAPIVIRGHAGYIESIAFSPTADSILTASRDGSVRLWAAEGNAYVALQSHGARIDRIAFAPTGRAVLTGCRDGFVRVFDLHGGLLAQVPYEPTAAAGFLPSSGDFAVSGPDHVVRVFDLAGREVSQLRGHTGKVVSISWAPDARQALTASCDGTVRRWSASGRSLAVLRDLPYLPRHALLVSGGDRLLVSWVPPRAPASLEGLGATLFDPGGTALAELGRRVRSIAVSPDGSRLATGSYDGVLGIWDASGRRLARVEAHRGGIVCLGFSSDGQLVASGSDDRTARIFTLDGRPVAVLRGHSTSVVSLAFHPGGHLLATGGFDKTVRLWDEHGRPLATLRHEGNVERLAFSPDGSLLATGSFGGTAQLWPVDPRALMGIAETRVTRTMTRIERDRYVDLLGR